jgi:hypothetical protein
MWDEDAFKKISEAEKPQEPKQKVLMCSLVSLLAQRSEPFMISANVSKWGVLMMTAKHGDTRLCLLLDTDRLHISETIANIRQVPSRTAEMSYNLEVSDDEVNRWIDGFLGRKETV